jgi:hypothetical protein
MIKHNRATKYGKGAKHNIAVKHDKWRTPKLPDRFNYESKVKTTEG